MAKFELVSVLEQDAILDGEPDFLPRLAVMNLLNHNSAGGTAGDLLAEKHHGEMTDPKRYTVQLRVYVKEI